MTDASERMALTSGIMALLEGWDFSLEDIRQVLHIDTPVRKMDRFRRSEAFPDEPDLNTRIEHLVGIVDGLRTAYPNNRQMIRLWLQRPHKRLGRRRPMDMIRGGEMTDLITVRAEIDCVFGWQQTDAAFR